MATSVIAVLALVGYLLALKSARQGRAAQAQAEAQAIEAAENLSSAEALLGLLATPTYAPTGSGRIISRLTSDVVQTRAAAVAAHGTPGISPQPAGPTGATVAAATAAAVQTIVVVQTQVAQSLIIQQALVPTATPTPPPTEVPTATPTPPRVCTRSSRALAPQSMPSRTPIQRKRRLS